MLTFKPQKGKAYEKLPGKTLATFDETSYVASTKYDGNQIFIVKEGCSISFFTSDWKEFYLPIVADELVCIPGDFVLVGEFMYGCEGKLGERRKSAILTTYRTNFAKGINNDGTTQLGANIKVFDCIGLVKGELVTDVTYITRINTAKYLLKGLKYIEAIETQLIKGKDARQMAKTLISFGWEGIMLVEPDTTYHVGKRVNHSIKLKLRPTADLSCIDTELGDGKYGDMIGALVLQDSAGRIVRVGSGLSDEQRSWHEDNFIGKIIEIEYEQLMDTYIQPTFICIREDKVKGE